MHISFTVTPDAHRARRQVRAAMRDKFRRLYVLGGLLAAAGVAMLVAGVVPGAAPLAIGAILVAIPWLLPRVAAMARTGVLAETTTYELTGTNVLARTASLSSGFAWDAVKRVEDTGEFWVVMVRGVGVLVLPWTLLPAAEADEARSFLIAHGLLTTAAPAAVQVGLRPAATRRNSR